MLPKPCQECGKPVESPGKPALFCSTGCRLKFNRRRRDRGTELYDLVMLASYENDAASWDLISKMVTSYRLSDEKLRGGRKSWQAWRTAQFRIPQAFSNGGDGR